jgi:hypothetical protein
MTARDDEFFSQPISHQNRRCAMHDIFHLLSTGRPAMKKSNTSNACCSGNTIAPDGEPSTLDFTIMTLAPCAGAPIIGG